MEPRPTVSWERASHNKDVFFLRCSHELRESIYCYAVIRNPYGWTAYFDYWDAVPELLAKDVSEQEAKEACERAYFSEVFG